MSKNIFDPIYGYITIDEIALKIINTPEFQRLRNLKQLGTIHYVYPSANHSRFEHSLGVYYLADMFINSLKENQPELKINNNDIQNIKISALCHDLGHGPFSHLFDKFLEFNNVSSKNINHESRSINILKYINQKYSINISDENINIISKIINPGKENKSFLYQIVANKVNGLDVDKFDYITRDSFYLGIKNECDYKRIIKTARVIDNYICFHDKIIFNIYDIYYNRAKLHNQVYNHHVSRAIDLMILDFLNIIKDDFNLIDSIESPASFSNLDDNILTLAKFIYDKQTTKLIKDIESREFYKMILEKKCTKEELQKNVDSISNLDKREIILDTFKIGISNDLMKNIKFYNHDLNSFTTFNKIHILLNFGFDSYTRIYVKNSNKSGIILNDIKKYIK